MEKQVPNLQISFDLNSIKSCNQNLKDELVTYNFLKEEIQGFIRMKVLTEILHPLRRVTTDSYNHLFIEYIEKSNFQLNLLQDSQNLNFKKFLEIQKLIFIVKKLNGKVSSFNTKEIDILSSLIHLQANSGYDLENSLLNLSTTTNTIPNSEQIYFYIFSALIKVLDVSTVPVYISSEMLKDNRLTTVRETFPELVNIEFKQHSYTMLQNYYFKEHFKLTYH